MSCCHNTTCPRCDPGIEAFYQEKIQKAKESVISLALQGIVINYEDLVGEAMDVWYEYCELKNKNQADESVETDEVFPDVGY